VDWNRRGGLSKFDPASETFTNFKHDPKDPQTLSSNYITAVAPAENGNLWVGTLGLGLDLFNPNTGFVQHFVHQDDDPNSLSENTIYALQTDPQGMLWIGTGRGGLSMLNPASEHFTRHLHNSDNPGTIIHNTVQALYIDREGAVWCGTAGGLSRFDPVSSRFTNYTTREGLPADSIYGILGSEDGTIWLSTGHGISRFDPKSGMFENFDVLDGLQSNQFNLFASHLAEDGEMFFGGPNGLNVFYPYQIHKNTYQPQVVLTDFQLFNQSLEPGHELLPFAINEMDKLSLTHQHTVFTVKFSALNYQIAEHNLYQYKLEGFDKDWSPPSSKRSATYTNLDPGQYTFLVRGSNNDGIWSEVSKALPIQIAPPWWQTTLFQTAFAVGVLGLVSGGVHLRFRNIRKHTLELEKHVQQRTVELREEVVQRQKIEQELLKANLQLQEQLKEITHLKDQLHELAIRDDLTGLYNRRYLSETLKTDLSRAQRRGDSVCAILLDIDHFKSINDTYGHSAGDQVLMDISEIICSSIRQEDTACRYGGEEFLIITSGLGTEKALDRAEKIRVLVNETVTEYNGDRIQVTISAGVASFPEHASGSDDLLNKADLALYQAKRMGRNRVMLYCQTLEMEN